MATIEKTVCDVCGRSAGVKSYRMALEPETDDTMDFDNPEYTWGADLCPRHVKTLTRFIERAIRPRGKAQKANAPQQVEGGE